MVNLVNKSHQFRSHYKYRTFLLSVTTTSSMSSTRLYYLLRTPLFYLYIPVRTGTRTVFTSTLEPTTHVASLDIIRY